MRRISLALLAALMIPPATAADPVEVQAKQLAPDQYELIVELPADIDPQQASSMLFPVAEQICAGRPAQMGRFRFKSDAPFAPGAKASSTQTFTQQIECGASNAVIHVARAPKTPPTEEDESAIRASTLKYLAAKDRNDFDAASALLGSEMAVMLTTDNWRSPRAAFNEKAGEPNHREVVRLTWYDDPAGAPAPGRYVAADYRGDYAHAGFYCGYVMWHLQPDGTYRIVREEEGQMPDEIAKTFTPEELASARTQIQCRD
jgi:hypothetical protein